MFTAPVAKYRIFLSNLSGSEVEGHRFVCVRLVSFGAFLMEFSEKSKKFLLLFWVVKALINSLTN